MTTQLENIIAMPAFALATYTLSAYAVFTCAVFTYTAFTYVMFAYAVPSSQTSVLGTSNDALLVCPRLVLMATWAMGMTVINLRSGCFSYRQNFDIKLNALAR